MNKIQLWEMHYYIVVIITAILAVLRRVGPAWKNAMDAVTQVESWEEFSRDWDKWGKIYVLLYKVKLAKGILYLKKARIFLLKFFLDMPLNTDTN